MTSLHNEMTNKKYHTVGTATMDLFVCLFVCLFCFVLMVFNATFNNFSVISGRSVLLVEETEVPGENHRPLKQKDTTLSEQFQILIEKSIPQYAHFPYLIQALPKRGWVKLI